MYKVLCNCKSCKHRAQYSVDRSGHIFFFFSWRARWPSVAVYLTVDNINSLYNKSIQDERRHRVLGGLTRIICGDG